MSARNKNLVKQATVPNVMTRVDVNMSTSDEPTTSRELTETGETQSPSRGMAATQGQGLSFGRMPNGYLQGDVRVQEETTGQKACTPTTAECPAEPTSSVVRREVPKFYNLQGVVRVQRNPGQKACTSTTAECPAAPTSSAVRREVPKFYGVHIEGLVQKEVTLHRASVSIWTVTLVTAKKWGVP